MSRLFRDTGGGRCLTEVSVEHSVGKVQASLFAASNCEQIVSRLRLVQGSRPGGVTNAVAATRPGHHAGRRAVVHCVQTADGATARAGFERGLVARVRWVWQTQEEGNSRLRRTKTSAVGTPEPIRASQHLKLKDRLTFRDVKVASKGNEGSRGVETGRAGLGIACCGSRGGSESEEREGADRSGEEKHG